MRKSDTKFLEGELRINNDSIKVFLYQGSKYSMFVKFNGKNGIQGNTIFDYLLLNFGKEKYKLSACKFIIDYDSDKQYSGRLLFTDNIYDFDYLFYNNQLVGIDKIAKDRELLKLQKEEIKDTFRKFTADLTYDIELYRMFFDEIDRQIQKEPESIRESIYATLLKTEGSKFITFLDQKLKDLEMEISNFTHSEHTLHGYYFRRQLRNIIEQSVILRRTNDKPRGYIGDSEMMKMIYADSYLGNSTFSKLLYKYSIDHDASKAVRNRLYVVSDYLKKEYDKSSHKNSFRLLSVACGPFTELETFFENNEKLINCNFVLLDQDELALKDAKETVFKVEKKLGRLLSTDFLQESIRTIIKDKNLKNRLGTFDFIYSMGLFDYLTTLVGKVIINKLFDFLKPGGVLLVGNFHYQNASRWFMEYWHDWVLYYRNELEFENLLTADDIIEKNIFFEESKCQMFLYAKKGGSG